MTEYLRAFTDIELAAAERAVAKLAVTLQGRKLEEGDWTDLYCGVKGTPPPRWSNLPFRDYLHDGLGVEFKVLCRKNPVSDIGKPLMHPSATRTISFSETDEAEDAKVKVLTQWASRYRSSKGAFERHRPAAKATSGGESFCGLPSTRSFSISRSGWKSPIRPTTGPNGSKAGIEAKIRETSTFFTRGPARSGSHARFPGMGPSCSLILIFPAKSRVHAYSRWQRTNSCRCLSQRKLNACFPSNFPNFPTKKFCASCTVSTGASNVPDRPDPGRSQIQSQPCYR